MQTIPPHQLKDWICEKLRRNFGTRAEEAGDQEVLKATALVLRDILSARYLDTAQRRSRDKQVHYLSLEFLLGRSLEKNAFNLGLLESLTQAIGQLGFSAPELFAQEPDAGLGNGGLGRLAACYLEAMTTQEIPATGYSICYELGIFKQKIIDGQQVELPDNWLEVGDAWLIAKVDETEEVRFGGRVTGYWENGRHKVRHEGYDAVLAIPRDMVIAGYGTEHANLLRLWDAKSPVPADMSLYSQGEYIKAVERQAMAEVIAKVLYPEDRHYEGKSLRLKQQYFFVSATAQSIVRKHRRLYGTLENFPDKHVIQINDTHPTLMIPELMRILLDEEGYGWEQAWHLVTNTVAYTNHTVMGEALERWPQQLIAGLLPRIWEIIREIAARYQSDLNVAFHGDQARVRDCAILWDGEVRMANLCVCACFSVNGVSALHSEILRREVFPHAAARCPEKFHSVTNGIDHRRWLAQSNPLLHQLVLDCGGTDYLLRPKSLAKLEAYRDDTAVLDRLGQIKRANKERFAAYARREHGLTLNPSAIFDVQVKRLHEYKRQLLNAMHILWLYQQLHSDPHFFCPPRVFLFGAKAAPGYAIAKDIIRMILSLSKMIRRDPLCKDRLQVAFLENYRVTLAEQLIPAAEVSEQISTAGKEASGTGNMKLMMNGALTLGTLDGANVEICQQVGENAMFLFGLTADQAKAFATQGYRPYEFVSKTPGLREVLDQMARGFGDGASYQDLANRLLFGAGGPADEYLLLADFDSYRKAQDRVGRQYEDRRSWNRMSLLNIARSGVFAADRSIREYARGIWHVPVRHLPE